MKIRRFSLALAATVILCGSHAMAVGPFDDAVAYYEFEGNLENTVTAGVSGNAFVLTNAPGFAGASGLVGTGLSYVDTSSQSIRLPFGTSTNLPDSFTVSAWYWQGTGTDDRHFVFESDTNYDVSYGTTNSTNSLFRSYVGQSSIGDATTSKGEWHHVLHSFESVAGTTTLRSYVDGNLSQSGTNTTASVSFPSINLGAHRSEGRFWDGFIDEVAIFDSALSAAGAGAVTFAGTNGQALHDLGKIDGVTLTGWAVDNFSPVAGANNDLGDGGFDGPYLRTQDSGDNTIAITMSDLDPHNVVSLGMIVAQLDSLDPVRDDDRFIVKLDGQEILSVGLGYGTSVDNNFSDEVVFDVEINGVSVADSIILDTQTLGGVDLFDSTNFLEHMYDLGLLDAFQNIPHTSDTLLLEIIGRQNQTGGEFYGIDNITVTTASVAIPEPSPIAMWGVLAALVVLGGRFIHLHKRHAGA